MNKPFPFKLETLIGLQKPKVETLLKRLGRSYRVVCEDGEYYIVTRDYCPDRVNLTVTGGLITEAHFG
jgi:hypothetical protein